MAFFLIYTASTTCIFVVITYYDAVINNGFRIFLESHMDSHILVNDGNKSDDYKTTRGTSYAGGDF